MRRVEGECGGRSWHTPRFRWRRLQFSLTVHKHTAAASSDRWVVQTSVIYDRKVKSTWIDTRHKAGA